MTLEGLKAELEKHRGGYAQQEYKLLKAQKTAEQAQDAVRQAELELAEWAGAVQAVQLQVQRMEEESAKPRPEAGQPAPKPDAPELDAAEQAALAAAATKRDTRKKRNLAQVSANGAERSLAVEADMELPLASGPRLEGNRGA